VFDWEMEKWFHLRIGDEGFGLVDGRVGIWNLVLVLVLGVGGAQHRGEKIGKF
jgi:hypothetical protein